jgi:hypothetical protein
MKKSLVASLLLSLLSLSCLSVEAKEFYLQNAPRNIMEVAVTCGSDAGASTKLIKLNPGERIAVGDPACQTFNIEFATANGPTMKYSLEAGRTYEMFWKDNNHWDLALQ